MSLNDLRYRHTDKFDLGYVQEFYDTLFIPRKESATKVLELGVYEGESIRLWRDFFTNATVYGIDVDKVEYLNSEPRIVGLTLDGYSDDTVKLLQKLEPNGFDIIIDDGPHTLESMEFFLKNYMSLLKSGGVLVLEDIINTSWTQGLVSLVDSSTARITIVNMGGKALTNDLVETWKNGLDVIIVEKS